MDDLIRRGALLAAMGLETATKYGNKSAEQQHNSYSTWMSYEIADEVNGAPAVDAVEVVRCGECKNNGGEIGQGDIWCDKMERGMMGNCYCSYGIRKEEHNGEVD